MKGAGMLSKGFCDVEIHRNPLWNHTLADSPDLRGRFQAILDANLVAMSFHEVVNLHRMVEQTSRLPGDIAEVGVFHGGSALVMALANTSMKRVHLFDTFSGIPETTKGVDLVNVGDVRGSELSEIKGMLKNFENIIDYHVGFFPDTASELPDGIGFSLVNLDMDVYASTKAGLEYFYPRMVRGGVIICHDYFSQSCPGVKKAVDEFFQEKPETLIGLWHTQIAMVKL